MPVYLGSLLSTFSAPELSAYFNMLGILPNIYVLFNNSKNDLTIKKKDGYGEIHCPVQLSIRENWAR